jgi:hypothetical protein
MKSTIFCNITPSKISALKQVVIYLSSWCFSRNMFHVFVKLSFEVQYMYHVIITNKRNNQITSLLSMSTLACYTALLCGDVH